MRKTAPNTSHAPRGTPNTGDRGYQPGQAPNWNFHQSSHTPRSRSGSHTPHAGGQGLLVVKILYWLCVAAALWFAYLNINPYAQAAKFVLNTVADSSFFRLLLALPLIGAAFSFVATASHWIIGFILWGIIQTIELFPIILKRDRAFMRTVIQDSDMHQQFQIRETDDPTAKALKRWYNRFPTLTISSARNWALGAYVVDFLICITVYPPCEGGFGDLMFLLTTGQWSALDWGNVVMIAVTLFAIEAIVLFLFWLGQIAWYYKASRQ